MKEKNIKKNYETIIYIIILIVILSCVFAFIRFRANFTEKYLIDYKYVFFDEGTANIINLKTGNTTSVEIEQFCKQEQQSVIWLQTTDRRYGDEERKVKEVCLTNESGETEVIFDTELLWDKAGVNVIYDIAYTENGRVIFTAGDSHLKNFFENLYLFEYTDNQEFVKLYDGNVENYFSVNANELIFTTCPENRDEIGEIIALNLFEDIPPEHRGYGDYLVYLNDEEALRFNRKHKMSVKETENSPTLIYMDFDPESLEEGCIVPKRTPIVSEDGDIVLICYVNSSWDTGLEGWTIGIYYVEENKLIDIYDYFRWIHLKKPDFDVEWHTKISATLISAD